MNNQMTATLPVTLQKRVDAYWSRFLAVSPETLTQPGLTVTTAPIASGLFMLKLNDTLICALSPDVAPMLRERIETIDPDDLFTSETTNELLTELGSPELVYGPGEVLYCTRNGFKDGPDFGRRLLTADDAESLHEFRQVMGWYTDHHRMERFEDWVCAIGIFDDGTLAALARVWVWDGTLGVISVATRLDCRNQGYGLAVVRGCTRWMLENTSLIPQLDGEIEQAGVHMARASGYTHYGFIVGGSGTCDL